MKKIIRVLGLLLLLIGLLAGAGAAFIYFGGIPKYEVKKIDYPPVQATPEKVALGAKIAAAQCVVCHRGTDGKLSGKLVTDIPKNFGNIFSKNITQDKKAGIGSWSDGDIAYLLRTGVRPDGQYLPIYMPKFPHMSDSDVEALIAYLRSDRPEVQASSHVPSPSEPSMLVKFLCRVAFKALPYPEKSIAMPAPESKESEIGKYLVTGRYDCWPCHSADFKKLNFMEPEKSLGYMGGGNMLLDLDGKERLSANITMDEATGIGSWNEDQFIAAMMSGVRPDGKHLRYPMLPYNHLDTAEIKAIWQYLMTVPKIKNEVKRDFES